MKIIAFVFSLSCSFATMSQTKLEISHSWAGNLSTARTLKTENRTRGYQMSPCFLSNHHNFKFGVRFKNANKLFASLRIGSIGLGFRTNAYSSKYPNTGEPTSEEISYITTSTGKLRVKQNQGLVSFGLLFEKILINSSPYSHGLQFGVEFYKMKPEVSFQGFEKVKKLGYATSDSTGVIVATHLFAVDEFINHRNFNVFLSLGYEFAYQFAKRWQLNVGALYHQGLFKMLSWHSYREFEEPAIGYKEFDEQWTYTRLSHFELNVGVTFQIDLKKKNKDKIETPV